MSDLEQARAAKRVVADRLGDDARVVGIGLAREEGDYVVQVRLAEMVEDGTVPASVSVGPGPTDVPVRWEVVGSIGPLSD